MTTIRRIRRALLGHRFYGPAGLLSDGQQVRVCRVCGCWEWREET